MYNKELMAMLNRAVNQCPRKPPENSRVGNQQLQCFPGVKETSFLRRGDEPIVPRYIITHSKSQNLQTNGNIIGKPLLPPPALVRAKPHIRQIGPMKRSREGTRRKQPGNAKVESHVDHTFFSGFGSHTQTFSDHHAGQVSLSDDEVVFVEATIRLMGSSTAGFKRKGSGTNSPNKRLRPACRALPPAPPLFFSSETDPF